MFYSKDIGFEDQITRSGKKTVYVFSAPCERLPVINHKGHEEHEGSIYELNFIVFLRALHVLRGYTQVYVQAL